MKLENQVCSLPLAQRLKELGVKQESYFAWRIYPDNSANLVKHDTIVGLDVSAFTVAELGRMLGKTSEPAFIRAYYEAMDFPQHVDIGMAQAMHNLMTDPDIGAKMLIYLIENNLITL